MLHQISLTLILAGATLYFTTIQGMANPLGSVTFKDNKNETITISRDLEPRTGTITNTITVQREDGSFEIRSVSTRLYADGRADVTRSSVTSDGRSSNSSNRLGGKAAHGGRAARGEGGRTGGAGGRRR